MCVPAYEFMITTLKDQQNPKLHPSPEVPTAEVFWHIFSAARWQWPAYEFMIETRLCVPGPGVELYQYQETSFHDPKDLYSVAANKSFIPYTQHV